MKSSPRNKLGLRSKLAALLIAATIAIPSCKTMEEYLPAVVVLGGAAASVLALNYYEDPEYALAAIGVVTALTPMAYAAAGSYVDLRRKQRELEELEEIEDEIRAEYEQSRPDPGYAGADEWGLAPGLPATAPATPAAAVAAQPADPPAGGPPGGPPAQTLAQPGAPPSTSPWGERYQGRTPTPRNAGGPLALEVAVLKRTPDGVETLSDNAVVYDGIANFDSADALQVFFRPSEDAYVYVINIDSVGRVQSLYPTTLPAEPVPGGTGVLLPGPEHWYGLDRYAGLEHFYFYASKEPQPELEAKLTPIVGRPLPELSGTIHTVGEPTVLETPHVVARGVTNVRPVTLAEVAGAEAPIEVTRYVALPDGTGVAATRVLDHR